VSTDNYSGVCRAADTRPAWSASFPPIRRLESSGLGEIRELRSELRRIGPLKYQKSGLYQVEWYRVGFRVGPTFPLKNVSWGQSRCQRQPLDFYARKL